MLLQLLSGSLFYNASLIEIIYSMLAFIAFFYHFRAFRIFTEDRSVYRKLVFIWLITEDPKLQIESRANLAGYILSRDKQLSECIRGIKQLFFLSLGIFAMFTPQPSNLLYASIFGVAFVAIEILLIIASYSNLKSRESLTNLGKVKDDDKLRIQKAIYREIREAKTRPLPSLERFISRK